MDAGGSEVGKVRGTVLDGIEVVVTATIADVGLTGDGCDTRVVESEADCRTVAVVSAKSEDWTSSETIKDGPDATVAEQKISPGAGAVSAAVPKEETMEELGGICIAGGSARVWEKA